MEYISKKVAAYGQFVLVFFIWISLISFPKRPVSLHTRVMYNEKPFNIITMTNTNQAALCQHALWGAHCKSISLLRIHFFRQSNWCFMWILIYYRGIKCKLKTTRWIGGGGDKYLFYICFCFLGCFRCIGCGCTKSGVLKWILKYRRGAEIEKF